MLFPFGRVPGRIMMLGNALRKTAYTSGGRAGHRRFVAWLFYRLCFHMMLTSIHPVLANSIPRSQKTISTP